ncbi:ABSCISIC ACID-INSENSITIVE 5-like protein 3 [Lotus japonicus]|uniref:ABSCISIC ACID-INSENSITIVE 5-like protein 3 n=1 Tax=Lotus japonicus TaxID=34305 RepID=UPI00258E2E16|nr:ABSCISIC ACID-INSENSITIVE 5-like protein 3 [Lotus japonicus]
MGNGSQEQQYPPLVRQGSLYNNLTFDEVQSQLGNTEKPLHNMNLDELLRNVISAESGLVVQNPLPPPDSFLLGNNTDSNGASSHKTSNEVWRDIVHSEQVYRSVNNNLQQSILGQTNLESFLARAMDPMVMGSQPQEWLPLQVPGINFQQQPHQEQHQHIRRLCPDFSVYKPVYENQVLDIGYSENSMATMPSTCSDSKEVDDVKRKHSYSDEMLEKTIERRKKRMAKNRESAARSRAKKQVSI